MTNLLKGHEDFIVMFEKEAKKRAITLERCQTLGVYDDDESYARDLGWNEGEVAGYEEGFKDGAEFGYNKANEQLTLPKDILGLWEQTVCEIRSEIKSWDLKGPHVSDYAKELCDKLEHSMCAVAGGPYRLRYSITD